MRAVLASRAAHFRRPSPRWSAFGRTFGRIRSSGPIAGRCSNRACTGSPRSSSAVSGRAIRRRCSMRAAARATRAATSASRGSSSHRARTARRARRHRLGLYAVALGDVLSGARGHRALGQSAPDRPAGRDRLDHLMASAAVPFVFAPVQNRRRVLRRRLDAPSRAAQLGDPSRAPTASSSSAYATSTPTPSRAPTAPPGSPSLAHLAGYMLDTLFMDGLYADIERLTRINLIVDQLGSTRLSRRSNVCVRCTR